jgi:hypothetical protein
MLGGKSLNQLISKMIVQTIIDMTMNIIFIAFIEFKVHYQRHRRSAVFYDCI